MEQRDRSEKLGPLIGEIPKMNLRKLVEETIIQSSTLAFVDFKFLMKTNPNATYFSIVSTLLYKALEAHEKHCPLFKRSRIYIKGNTYTFTDNFQLYLDGKIPEEYMVLIPRIKPHNLDTSMLHTRRSWGYNRPVMFDVFNVGSILCDYMTSYPMKLVEDKDCDDFSEDSALYYMPLHGGTSKDSMFKRQFYFQILKYLKGIKNNLRYPDMPMELLQGIDEDYHQLQSELQEFYRKCNAHGALYQ